MGWTRVEGLGLALLESRGAMFEVLEGTGGVCLLHLV